MFYYLLLLIVSVITGVSPHDLDCHGKPEDEPTVFWHSRYCGNGDGNVVFVYVNDVEVLRYELS